MSGRLKLWISAVAALVCAQALSSLFLQRGFALIALSDILAIRSTSCRDDFTAAQRFLPPAAASGCSGL